MKVNRMVYPHYTAGPLGPIRSNPKEPADNSAYRRPTGLWLSLDDDWPAWCQDHNWNLNRLAFRYLIHLNPDSNLLVLDSDEEIQALSQLYSILNKSKIFYLDWPRLRTLYTGVLFSAECFRTYLHPNPNLTWVRGWDVRSACIWNAGAILKVEQDINYPRRCLIDKRRSI
jgi:hypothetical protein